MTGGVFLKAYLAALDPWLEDGDVTDILINQPGEVWIERLGAPMQRVTAPDISAVMLSRLTQQIAAASHQGVNREYPLLAASLPNGARVQAVTPPATRAAPALAIRKHSVADLTIDAYAEAGAFADVGVSQRRDQNESLKALLAGGRHAEFLREAARSGRNILISGGTGTGKTTFLNALLKEIPPEQRLIVIEDTPEVRLDRPNAVGLIAVKGDLGEARITVDDLMQAALRMRPDRLLVGEVRGREAFTFLRAINTGHPGSITTVHADSPEGALEQLAFMTLQAGLTLTRDDVLAYARRTIDVIVQLTRAGGRRRVSSIVLTGQMNPR